MVTLAEEQRRKWAEEAATRRDTDVAKDAGVSVPTIRAWRRRFGITKLVVTRGGDGAYRTGRKDLATTDDKLSLAKAFRKHEPLLVRRTIDLIQSDDLGAVASGLRIAYDRGWGKPFQAASVEIDFSGNETADAWVAALTEMVVEDESESDPGD